MARIGFEVGIDRLCDAHRARLVGRRVALLSHQAALDAAGATSAQRLRRELGDGLVALFGPEHGFFGQAGAGEHTYTRKHPDWGIPVYSLYGERRKPAPEMLRGIDVVVCDLQDLGVRCYTYLATLRNMLEACAEAGVAVIVADRPVPLPDTVDGPVAEPAFFSFVAPLALPMVYGMTPGETARWLHAQLALQLDLTVVPMCGWRREAGRGVGWPDFLPPSPGIKTWETAAVYPATVFCEGLPGVDCGRGTNLVFRVLGAPWFKAERLCGELSARGLSGVTCHPYRYTACGRYEGRELDGIRLTVTDPAVFKPVLTTLVLLDVLGRQGGLARVWRHKGVRPDWFDKLFGTDAVRRGLLAAESPEKIAAAWQLGLDAFRKTRAAALLY